MFITAPIFGLQAIATRYFQAVGRGGISAFLSLSRQLLFYLPLLFILPSFMGLDGVWWTQPTPVVGVVGLVEDVAHTAGSLFMNAGEAIVLLGCEDFRFDGSLYLRRKTGKVAGQVVKADAKRHAALCELIVAGIEKGVVKTAHDVSEGGLLWAVAESVAGHGVGATLDNVGHDAAELFGEAPSMAFVTVKEADLSCLTLMAEEAGVQAVRIGTTGGDALSVKNLFDIPVKDIVAASRKPL